jgi:hypothetical protein
VGEDEAEAVKCIRGAGEGDAFVHSPGFTQQIFQLAIRLL